jgi:hypothetical protein
MASIRERDQQVLYGAFVTVEHIHRYSPTRGVAGYLQLRLQLRDSASNQRRVNARLYIEIRRIVS